MVMGCGTRGAGYGAACVAFGWGQTLICPPLTIARPNYRQGHAVLATRVFQEFQRDSASVILLLLVLGADFK